VPLDTWRRQERAFGLLKKVYAKRAGIRGQQAAVVSPYARPYSGRTKPPSGGGGGSCAFAVGDTAKQPTAMTVKNRERGAKRRSAERG
jgi:hypothetical protein